MRILRFNPLASRVLDGTIVLCVALVVAVLSTNGQAAAQTVPGTVKDYLRLELPDNGPIRHLGTDWGRSRIIQRGSAASTELHLTFQFQNTSSQSIHGITLLLQTSGVAAGGRASVTLPGLRVQPGQQFPAKVDLRLLQPLMPGTQPVVRVQLDGVLFADLSFSGNNRLNSRRLLTSLEMEIQQDRKYLREVLEAKGKQVLGEEMRQMLARQADLPRVDLRWARQGRATAIPASEPVRFAFLEVPSSPLEPMDASVRIAGHEAVQPRLRVRNQSSKEIVYAEVGWIVRDLQGREFYAGTVPATGDRIRLAPGAEALVEQEGVMQFHEQSTIPGNRQPLPIRLGEMVGYVSQVQFADGSIWMPDRYAAGMPAAVRQLRVSPEQQRLASIYLRHGIDALVAELNR